MPATAFLALTVSEKNDHLNLFSLKESGPEK